MVIRWHQRQHPPRGVFIAVPEEAIEPLLVVLRAHRRGVMGPKTALVAGQEIVLHPSRAQQIGAGVDLARLDHQFGLPHLAGGADRRVGLEPVGGGVVAFGDERGLGVALQRLLVRPGRVVGDEVGYLGKASGREVVRVVEPAHDFRRQRILALRGLGIGLGPVAALGRDDRGGAEAQIRPGELLRVRSGNRQRKDRKSKNEYSQESVQCSSP